MKEQIASSEIKSEYEEIITPDAKRCDEIINSLIQSNKDYKVITKRMSYTCGSSPISENIEDSSFIMDTEDFTISSMKVVDKNGETVLEYVPKKYTKSDKAGKITEHYLKIKK